MLCLTPVLLLYEPDDLDRFSDRQNLLDLLAEEDWNRDLNLCRHELRCVIHADAENPILKLPEIDRPELKGFVPLLACCGILFLLELRVNFNEKLFVGVCEFTLGDPQAQDLYVRVQHRQVHFSE